MVAINIFFHYIFALDDVKFSLVKMNINVIHINKNKN